MNSFENFLQRHYQKIALALLLMIFFKTCGNPTRITNKKLDALNAKVDSLEQVVATKTDLKVEGLKSEKRMIQSTDRKMLDVQRQAAIDEELKSLEK
jgi:hypothetical protein